MTKKLVALVQHGFEDLELMYPVIRLGEAGIQVVIAGEKEGDHYVGKHGYPCAAHTSYHDIRADGFDGVLIPGGWAPDKLRSIPNILEMLKKMDADQKVIAFICHGGWVPISARIVKGRKITGTKAIQDDLLNAGAIWHDEPVVIDEHLISSRTPKDLAPFAKAIVEALA